VLIQPNLLRLVLNKKQESNARLQTRFRVQTKLSFSTPVMFSMLYCEKILFMIQSLFRIYTASQILWNSIQFRRIELGRLKLRRNCSLLPEGHWFHSWKCRGTKDNELQVVTDASISVWMWVIERKALLCLILCNCSMSVWMAECGFQCKSTLSDELN